MVKLAADGNFAEAAAIHRSLFPLIKTLFLDGNPVGIKYAMKLAGTDTGDLRLPLWEASEATKKAIEAGNWIRGAQTIPVEAIGE